MRTGVEPASGPSADSDESISVVICCWSLERWDALCAAIDSVEDQTQAAEQILVVVDHNADLVVRLRSRYPSCTVVESASERRGLSGARNTGLALAHTAIVAFLDDDAVAPPDWLAGLVRAYERNVIAVGGSVEPVWPSSAPGWFPPEFAWVVGCTHSGMPRATACVRNLVGANMSVRRSVVERVGGFAEELGRVGALPAGCEETEFFIRAGRAWGGRGRILFVPELRVSHSVSASRTTLRYFVTRCFGEGISKAAVARMVGRDRGLSEERRYVTTTLPVGVVSSVASAIRTRRTQPLMRAFAILLGLAATVGGYARGVARSWSAQQRSAATPLA